MLAEGPRAQFVNPNKRMGRVIPEIRTFFRLLFIFAFPCLNIVAAFFHLDSSDKVDLIEAKKEPQISKGELRFFVR